VASRAVSLRRGSRTQTSACPASSRIADTGSGIATEWPCDTTGLVPTTMTSSARSWSGRPLSATAPPTRSATSTLAVPSMVSGLNFAGVPIAPCSTCAIR